MPPGRCPLPLQLGRIIVCQDSLENRLLHLGRPVYLLGQLGRQDQMPRNRKTNSDR